MSLPSRDSGSDAPARPLLQHDPDRETSGVAGPQPAITRRIYISHFLSTWNSRVFEFGAILYLAYIFPDTLLPMSIYALARGVAAILFAPAVGHYIDTGNRLAVVRFSIVVQRVVVAASCAVFWVLARGDLDLRAFTPWLLVLLALLACVEKLCSVMNMIAVEKDWVVVVAQGDDLALRALNAQMRRIDLTCKLVGPLIIGLVDGLSTEIAILANFGMNMASVLIEYYAIARVYQAVPDLQQPKQSSGETDPNAEPSPRASPLRRVAGGMRSFLHQLRFYFCHRALLPSFAGALLYFTVLAFGGQMVTYLLSAGYNSMLISIARTVSVAFEISATWIAPTVMRRIGPIRSGIWFVSWQMCCLAAAMSAFWTLDSRIWAASSLVAGTMLSRVGLWGFDLSVQVIVQEEVEAAYRGSFSSVEAAWQNVFELCSYATTIIFSRPDQFHWPVSISCIAVMVAGGMYAGFVRMRRGHLFHPPHCIAMLDKRAQEYERVPSSRTAASA
ncbi:hypothetical protein P170DRAFT_454594 [Aspergillus steynii IBT 23096]|uniref:Solute carrier family 40 member n=1 Tax=Aspergillus steynii IBT 23096 TaxID=1392250 RepID=A0A2I2GAG2_9EURO|nr:uncharacterized protein P170DRAFT_454594 [Aspergillus steynii IBT 23096]PLB49866.1 hypothetical protein P170DRAFT_454594 [Aspergillus steynii IBT 23096]